MTENEDCGCFPQLMTWDQVKARMDERHRRHAARPWPIRRSIDAWRWFRWTWRSIWHPPPWKRVKWRWQRSQRGWADCDWWSLDSYIVRVLAGALTAMAEKNHAYPGVKPWETPEEWNAYLKDMVARLSAWNNDTWTDDGAFETTRAAMEEFGRNFGYFWDLQPKTE